MKRIMKYAGLTLVSLCFLVGGQAHFTSTPFFGGHCELALQSYKSYLREDPKSPKRAKVESYIAELEKCPPPPAAVTTTPPPPPPAATPEPIPVVAAPTETVRPKLAFVAMGAGAAIVASGASLMGWARLDYDAFVAARAAQGLTPVSTSNDSMGRFASFHDPEGNEVAVWGH